MLFFSLLMLIGLAALLDLLDGANGSALVAIIGILETALGVAALIFNAIAITGFSCSPEKYAKKRGLLIAAAVLNFVLAILLLISLCTAFTAMVLVVFLASLAAGVLLIVDICLESKRVANATPVNAEPANTETVEPEQNA